MIQFALTLLMTFPAFAYIPNINDCLHDAFDGRRAGPTEVLLRHRIFNSGGEPYELEEQILRTHKKTFFVWKSSAFGVFTGESDDKSYFINGASIPMRSVLLLKYLTGSSADEFRDIALREQFLNKDQFFEFNPNYPPDGDPQTWGVKDNYIRHQDVAYRRLRQGVAIGFIGMENSNDRKELYFDPGIKGIKRIEWKEGAEIHAWNFDAYTKFGGGRYPKTLSFESNGADTIVSDLVYARPLKDKVAVEFKNLSKKTKGQSLPSGLESALHLLLSYR